MTEETSLNKKNSRKVFAFIFFNVLLLWSVLLGASGLPKISELWNKLRSEDGIVMVLAPIITVLLNGLLPVNLKFMVVFWRIRNPMPGCRAFSKLAYTDARIDIDKLREKHGILPEPAVAQNRLWYEISRTHADKTRVRDSHENFLFTRDVTGLSAIFLLIYLVILLVRTTQSTSTTWYPAFLLVQYLSTAVVARNYGNRFVCNALVEDSV